MVLSEAGGVALGLKYDRRSGYLYVAGWTGDNGGLVGQQGRRNQRRKRSLLEEDLR